MKGADSTSPSAGEGEIHSREVIFEKREGIIRNVGEVHLTIPGALDLRCEDLLAQRDATGKFSTIIATNHVVIQLLQQPEASSPSSGSPVSRPVETNWAYCSKAVFIGTNNTVVLTGSPEGGPPRVETATASITAEELTYNRTTGRFVGSGKSMTRFKVGQLNINTKRDSGTNAP